jgi:hypothetical protein
MFSPSVSSKAITLTFAFLLISSPTFCDPIGIIDYAIEWGQTSKENYTFVFSGKVTREGRPCANAQVSLDIETSADGVVTQSAQAGDDGVYQIAITFTGRPSQASGWKLEARSSGISHSSSAEAEGRVILREGHTTVVVDRTLPLVEA